MSSRKTCPECNQNSYEYKWCKPYAQLNANHYNKVIEWIPYDRFKDVKQIGKGGFGTIHYARWIDGQIYDVLNEMEIHLKIYNEYFYTSIEFYGITQDPETHSYTMVLDYAKDENLREYLKINFNNIDWGQKLYNLHDLSCKLRNIHELDIVHQDFHPGNILSSSFKSDDIMISDFGLIGANPNNPEKKNIFGVLPHQEIILFIVFM
ncbi:hypothetical protein Glove_132g285 [Diversispora epigaea]|uniref:Protein kinase domain-containing protein n=1 Tax=Diversispora epigaea TaxID=1348612 RepID=A0A397IXH0_9GLOM|nr:hypothetical protein Glove_132g285 [Diversispora epigaea]